MTSQNLNNQDVLNDLDQKINRLENILERKQLVINAHPILFVIVLVVFFITMDFWATAAYATIEHVHPRGKLVYWEYIILAIISLGVLIFVTHQSGIHLRMISTN